MDEQQLLKALATPSEREAAFTMLVRQYSEKLYWVVRHIVGTHEDADDVIQNVFLKVWNKLDEFRGDSKVSTWLHRVAVNESLDHLRRQKKFSLNTSDPEALRIADNMHSSFSDQYFDGDDIERLLREAIETLPEAQRVTFTMKYYENMQYSEISKILGTSEGGLKANYHHAAEKIKRYILAAQDK